MKCSSCGKEFGNGVNCQSCGIDRFVGLGEYNGFRVPKLKEDKVTPNDNSSPNDSTIEVNGCNSAPSDNQSEKGLFKESEGDRKSSSQMEQNKLCVHFVAKGWKKSALAVDIDILQNIQHVQDVEQIGNSIFKHK